MHTTPEVSYPDSSERKYATELHMINSNLCTWDTWWGRGWERAKRGKGRGWWCRRKKAGGAEREGWVGISLWEGRRKGGPYQSKVSTKEVGFWKLPFQVGHSDISFNEQKKKKWTLVLGEIGETWSSKENLRFQSWHYEKSTAESWGTSFCHQSRVTSWKSLNPSKHWFPHLYDEGL